MFKKADIPQERLLSLGVKPSGCLGGDYEVASRVPLTHDMAKLGLGEHLINLDLRASDESPQDEVSFAILDTETTGFDSAHEEIIEVGILRGLYNSKKKRIVTLERAACFLEQPSKPLAPIITEVTGLTDKDLEGHRINDSAIERIMDGVNLVIAHNAKFDRSFIDKHRIGRFFKGVTWACSSKGGDINWKAAGHSSSALASLLRDYGFFFNGHRASVDCMATAWLLMVAQTQFAELLEASTALTYSVQAVGSPYEVKDALKGAGYLWNAKERLWEKHNIKGDSELREEVKQLATMYPKAQELVNIISRSPTAKHAS